MRTVIGGLLIGVTCLQLQANLFSPQLLLLSLLSFLCLSAITLFRNRHRPINCQSQQGIDKKVLLRLIWQFLLAAGIGFCWAGVLAHQRLQYALPSEWEGRDLEATGVVDSLPGHTERGWQFNFRVERYLLPRTPVTSTQVDIETAAKFPQRIAVAWFQDNDKMQRLPEIKPGQRWHLKLRLKRPHGNANPDGFDYEVWLLEQNLRATGTVRYEAGSNIGAENNRLVADFVPSLNNYIERARYVVQQRIAAALPNAQYAGVIRALVIGDQRDITAADWTVFNRTGIGHLISISGLHITMIAGLFAGLIHLLWRYSFFTRAQLPLLIPAQKIAILAGVLVAVMYVALAGFGVPAQRTLWMLLVLAVALWRGKEIESTQVLGLAWAIVILLDPWAVLWPGFWLSFAAVAVLMYVSIGQMSLVAEDDVQDSRWQKLRRQLILAAQAQYAITLGLVPLTLLLFAQFSLLSPIANAIAIPLISFVVTPLALLGSVLPPLLATPCLDFAHFCISVLVQFLNWLSHSSWAVWQAPLPTWWMFGLAFVGIALLLAPKGFPARWMGLFACLPLFLPTVQRPAFGAMHVTVFDIGQGAAVLVETAGHQLLYDTGPGMSPEVNSASRILLPYFKTRGMTQLDLLMISHSDSDHSSGAIKILQNLQVSELSSSLPINHPIVQAAVKSRRCEAGQSWDWDGVHFEIVHPVPVIYTSDKWKTNALSCTLKISTPTHSLLLAGDIEAIQEDELVNSIADKLQSDVLLAPHHGSGTSSTTAFLQAVNPQFALFQVGYLNRYHHPKPEVMQRYLDFGIKPLRTDTSGAITLQFGSAIEVSTYRQQYARYWYP